MRLSGMMNCGILCIMMDGRVFRVMVDSRVLRIMMDGRVLLVMMDSLVNRIMMDAARLHRFDAVARAAFGDMSVNAVNFHLATIFCHITAFCTYSEVFIHRLIPRTFDLYLLIPRISYLDRFVPGIFRLDLFIPCTSPSPSYGRAPAPPASGNYK